MRNRVISIRLAQSEFQALKIEAEQVGISVPLYIRRKALDALQIGQRLDIIERLVRGIPERKVIGEAFTRLAAKIDQARGPRGAS